MGHTKVIRNEAHLAEQLTQTEAESLGSAATPSTSASAARRLQRVIMANAARRRRSEDGRMSDRSEHKVQKASNSYIQREMGQRYNEHPVECKTARDQGVAVYPTNHRDR